MSPLFVGNADCSYVSVCNTFQNTQAYKLPVSKWKEFSQKMVAEEDATNLAGQIAYRKCTYPSAYEQLLTLWRELQKDDATLENLIKILDGSDLCDAADKLREKFELPPKRKIELSREFQQYNDQLKTLQNEIKQHIGANMGELSRYTNITSSVEKKLLEEKVITEDEINGQLKDAPSAEATAVRFYNIVMNKPEVYNKLIAILEDNKQYKASWKLRSFYRNLPNRKLSNANFDGCNQS